MLQRRLRIGYTRASRLVETMQEKGIISQESGPQGFEILDYGPAAPPADEQ
jgi:S-DNA-T family DNA segregation ATPase FtsK/SpoIIIE